MDTNLFSKSSPLEYRKLIFMLAAWLRKLVEIADKLNLNNISLTSQEVLRKVESSSFSIAVVGEFKRGKSSLINALLGQDILPTNILPTTATLNRIKYGIEPQIQIHFKNGKIENIESDKLSQYVTKLTPESKKIAADVKEAVIYYPISYCRNDVDIIDTPGLEDEAAMTAITLSTLGKVDAAVFVTMALAPLSKSEEVFLSEKLLKQNISRVVFVVTGIDRCHNTEDSDKAIQRTKDKIRQIILLGAQKEFDPKSNNYEKKLNLLEQLEVVGISAHQALQAKKNGDSRLLVQSRFSELEAALERLIGEKGKLLIKVSIDRVISTSEIILHEISAQKLSLEQRLITTANNYNLIDSILNGKSLRSTEYLAKCEDVLNDIQSQILILLDQLRTELQEAVIEVLGKISSALFTGENFQIIERLKSLDNRVIEILENHSRRWAGKIQVKVRRSVLNTPEIFRPEPELTLEWMNSVGKYGVDFGSSLKQQVLQSCLACTLYEIAEKGLTKKNFLENFRHKYISHFEAIIIHQYESSKNSRQELNRQIFEIFNTSVPGSMLPEKKEQWLIAKRLSMAREETRIELALQDLQEIQRETEEIREAAYTIWEQLTD